MARDEFAAVKSRIQERIASIGSTVPGLVWTPNISGLGTASTSHLSVGVSWDNNCMNSVRGAKLRLHMTTERLGSYGWQEGRERVVAMYDLHLAEDESTWQWVDGRGVPHSSVEVADDALRRLLAEHEKRKKAELQRRQRMQ